MAWDPAVLRKYNTTGHFRLINQVRSELKDNPLVRPKDGQSVGEANLSRSLTRALEGRAGSQRYRRSSQTTASTPGLNVEPSPASTGARETQAEGAEASPSTSEASFRDRLNAIDLR